MTSKTIYDFSAKDNKGNDLSLSALKGRVLLIVNTASACGFTPQYAGLQELSKSFKDEGLEVIAFPCNQFGKQEKGNNSEIASFCDLNFNISFPLMEKIEVNGPNSHPLFSFLKQQAPGIFGTKGIKWNFTKFLVNRDGTVIKRYSPKTKPEEIANDIKQMLKS